MISNKESSSLPLNYKLKIVDLRFCEAILVAELAFCLKHEAVQTSLDQSFVRHNPGIPKRHKRKQYAIGIDHYEHVIRHSDLCLLFEKMRTARFTPRTYTTLRIGQPREVERANISLLGRAIPFKRIDHAATAPKGAPNVD